MSDHFPGWENNSDNATNKSLKALSGISGHLPNVRDYTLRKNLYQASIWMLHSFSLDLPATYWNWWVALNGFDHVYHWPTIRFQTLLSKTSNSHSDQIRVSSGHSFSPAQSCVSIISWLNIQSWNQHSVHPVPVSRNCAHLKFCHESQFTMTNNLYSFPLIDVERTTSIIDEEGIGLWLYYIHVPHTCTFKHTQVPHNHQVILHSNFSKTRLHSCGKNL